jgi:hypothetical protein
MNETPDQPGPPGEDAGDHQDGWVDRTEPSMPPSDADAPPDAPGFPDQPPMASSDQPSPAGATQQALSDLPPLDDLDDTGGPKRGWLRGSRLIAASVAVVVLLGGGVALARSGDDGDGGSDGVATVDGSTGDQASADDDGGGGGGNRPDPSELQDAMLDYAKCMRDHGIDMPDPEFSDDGNGMVIQGGGPGGEGGTTGGPGAESDEFEAADDECNDILDDVRGEMPKMSPEEIAEMQDKLLAMAECMRSKGYDMPDPQVSDDGRVQIEMRGSGPDSGPAGAGDPRNEKFQEDQEACNSEAGLENGPMSAAGGGGSGSGGSTT